MDFVIIFGPQAVGKMTVGEELAKQKEYKLFHNHMTIDLVLKLFTWEEGLSLIGKMRNDIMETMARSSNKGMIFTYVWAFDSQNDWDYIEKISTIFRDHNVYYVELNAGLDTRINRNKTENRLEKKWTKRNIEESESRLKGTLTRHRTTSFEGEVPYQNYLRINNENLTAKEAADLIITTFNL